MTPGDEFKFASEVNHFENSLILLLFIFMRPFFLFWCSDGCHNAETA